MQPGLVVRFVYVIFLDIVNLISIQANNLWKLPQNIGSFLKLVHYNAKPRAGKHWGIENIFTIHIIEAALFLLVNMS